MSYSFKSRREVEKCYENNSGCQTHLAWGIWKAGSFLIKDSKDEANLLERTTDSTSLGKGLLPLKTKEVLCEFNVERIIAKRTAL